MRTVRLFSRSRIRASERIVLAVAALSVSASSAWTRTFDWVVVEPTNITTNPAFLQSALTITPSGEPVRASIALNRGIYGSTYYGDYLIDHRSAAGILVWSVVLEGKVFVKNLRIDSIGTIIVHGSYRESMQVGEDHGLTTGSSSPREFLLSIAPDHEVNWLIDPGTTDSNLSSIEALTIDAADRVWIGVSRWPHETAIVRLNANGTTAETYLQQGSISVTGLAVDPDGTVWATGPTSRGPHSFNGLEASAPFDYNFYLVKYGPGGVGQWAQFVEDVTFQSPYLVSDGSGTAYVAGSLHGDFPFGDLIPEGIDWVFDFFLAKVDADGNFLWLREVPADDYGGDAGVGRSSFVACPDDDGVFFAGFSRFSVDWGGDDNPPPSYGSEDVLVLEYSFDGEFRWAKTAGAPGTDIADAVAVDADGNVFIAGHVAEGAHFDDQQVGDDFINVFVASLPAENPSGVGEVTSGPELSLVNQPNPFHPETSIRFRLSHASPVRLEVFDASGARVATLVQDHLEAREYVVTWDGLDDAGHLLPSGVYLGRLETPGKVMTRRMTVVR